MHLELGDMVVYPAHGVGRIEALEERTVGDQKCNVLVMRILENGMRITIPAKNLDEVGLRPLIKKEAVAKVYKLFQHPAKAPESANWNRRQRDYMEKIKTGDPFDVASVMCELLSMRVEKELSFGERKLLDTVKALLVKELALASQKTEQTVEEEILAFFPPAKGSSAKS